MIGAIVLTALVAWALRQFALPLVSWYADLLLLLPYAWWFAGQRRAAWYAMLLSAGLVDIILPSPVPLYLVTTCTTIILFWLLIEPYIAQSTLVTRLVALVGWLLIWRASFLAWLTLAWFMKIVPTAPNLISLSQIAIWLMSGIVLWWLVWQGQSTWLRRATN